MGENLLFLILFKIKINILLLNSSVSGEAYNLLNDIDPLPNDPDTNAVYEPEKFRNKVFDYIQSVGRVVRISELSNSFWGNRYFLGNLIDERGIDVNQEFRAVTSVLGRLKKYSLSAGKIRLSFSKSDIDQGRIFRGDGQQLILENPIIAGKFDRLNE